MYFNGIPQGFGQQPQQQPQQQGDDFMDRPYMGYTQGVGSLPAQPSAPAPQLGNISPPSASTTGGAGKSLQPVAPMSKPMFGQAMAGGGAVGSALDKSGVVSGGIAALRGEHPDPRSALAAYEMEFGPDATSELIRGYADGGVVSGPGSGVADLIPGSIDGREDVRIASGEYVIPAWAVATLGDGSTEAGARVLDAMVARLREEGSELIKGVEPIKPNEFLPA